MKTDAKKNTCQTCVHFIQHYVWSGKYTAVNCGHCVRTHRRKNRPALAEGCEHWAEQTQEARRENAPGEEYVLRVQVVEKNKNGRCLCSVRLIEQI